MNKLITINLSFYNQSDNMLLKHINTWESYPDDIKNLFTFYIIDDASKKPASEIIKKETDLDLHLYRVEEDLYCNIAGVRNLGAKECNTPWMVILDMDTIISKELAQSMIELANKNINNNIVFKFNRKVPDNSNHIKHNKPHPAICLIRKSNYWKIGGCEEDLVGHYGYTDPSFWYRAKNKKVSINIQKKLFLLYYPEGESDINRDNKHNKKLFEKRKKDNKWSNKYIRFKWHKVF
jgi:hypothetical protein